MEYYEALNLSKKFFKLLEPACTRIEAVGSVKRKDPEVLSKGCHDIEFLLIPDSTKIPPVFGAGLNQPKNKLERLLLDLRGEGVLRDPERKANGERYKKLTIVEASGLNEFNLELWIVRPETWAIQSVIRTGPSAFSARFVKNESETFIHKASGKTYKGLLPDFYEYVSGETVIKIRHTGATLDLGEEADAIRLLGLRQSDNYWIPPQVRYQYT